MTGDLLANKKHLNEILGPFFVYAKNAKNAILRLTLRHVLTESLELKFLCENVAFVLNDNYEYHNFAQLLIGHKYAHRKSGAFSLDMSICTYVHICTYANHYIKVYSRVKCTNHNVRYRPICTCIPCILRSLILKHFGTL